MIPTVTATAFFVFGPLLLLPFPHFGAGSRDVFPPEVRPTKSGYLPVGSFSGSAIFYMFYEAQNHTDPLSETPLLIWLQGGPGCSSLIGNFFELGPWRVTPGDQKGRQAALHQNPGSWNRLFGLLFLDNPIGVGFSIAAKAEEIPRDQTSVAKHLFRAIQGFLSLYPSSKYRPIYIAGESYGGKYVPAIGYYIVKQNSRSSISERVNLRGISVGNGLTDPPTQVGTHAVNAYFSGLINEKQKGELEAAQRTAIDLTNEKKWSEATNVRSKVLGLLLNMTGLATLYDFRRAVPYDTSRVGKLLGKKEVKAALGVNESMIWEECSDLVEEALHEDVMKSARFMVDFLLGKTKVLLYQGQCDLRDGVVSTEAWMRKLKWEKMREFEEAERMVWKVEGKLAGYVQKLGRLSHVVVLGAGHFVPADQPLHSLAMIEEWVLDRGVFGLGSKKRPALSADMVL